MRFEFLSPEWFTKVDELIAAAGDLKIPEPMRVAKVNITVKGAKGDTQVHMKDGLFQRGHEPSFTTSLTVGEDIARKIFVHGDAAAGVQAFLEGNIQVEGDLATVVAMQTVEPSQQQMQLAKQIAAITA
ncbi:MAG TPA: hypothetical protein VIV40_29150 [Kofleriaceae bacterium]|jgi:hypothetical protein